MASDRTFDIVLFGATGFTGGLAADYLAQHAGASRWAIAGRSLSKLTEVRERVKRAGGAAPEMLEADVGDPQSLAKMTAQARVVMTTVGPYVRYGEPLVAACVATGTDYVDITGEPAFVADIITKHDEAAKAAKVRIVPCCGFDSIPHDLGAQFTVEQLPSTEAISIRAFVRAGGSVSGGTWHSAIGAFSDVKATNGAVRTIVESIPLRDKRSVDLLPMSLHRESLVNAWGVPMPTIDPAMVLRSARQIDAYGPSFRYGHFAKVKTLGTALAGIAAIGTIAGLSRNEAARAKLLELRAPGEGPTEEQRRRGFFEVDFLGESSSGKRVRTLVAGGEPGYQETSKMISESALCLAQDREALPPRYGILTTAAAMGPVLRARLVRAGMRFEVRS